MAWKTDENIRMDERRRNDGFTLLEVLLTVAMLVILLGLSMAGIARYRDHLKITELDNTARDIYMAAQNRAVLLQNSGRLDGQLKDGKGYAVTLTEGKTESENGGTRYIKLTKDSTPEDKAVVDELIPVGTIDPTLRDNGQFYVVYDPASGSVTDVFFVEKKTDAMPDIDVAFELAGAGRDARMKNTPMVGYYGGRNADEIGTRPLPTPGVEVFIENGDELTLTVRYAMPADGVDEFGNPVAIAANRTPNVTLLYGGKEVTLLAVNNVGHIVSPADSRLTKNANITASDVAAAEYTWVLDSLESGKQFSKLEFRNSSGAVSCPDLGGDFTVKASLRLTAPGCIESAYYATGTDNSLFAKGSTYNTTDDDSGVLNDTALIANLRHLQNLHPLHSNVGGGTVKAEQLCNIDCTCARNNTGDALEKDDSGNPKPYNFIPIVNMKLSSYDGRQKNITNLKVEASGNAGLFGEITVAGTTIQHVRLINADVKSTAGGDAGALAGSAKSTTFDDCRVYWEDSAKLADTTLKKINYKVSGKNAGGLIGSASTGTSINNYSFAATTVSGTDTAGGLIGKFTGGTGGTVTITNSYADCYLKTGTGENSSAGGLVGVGAAGLTDCYAAGFIVDPQSAKTAGLVFGTGETTGSNVYSVVRVLKTSDGSLTKPAIPLYGEIGDGSDGVHYLYKAADVDLLTQTSLGGAFEYEAAKPETHTYDLRHKLKPDASPSLKLTPPYIFPGLNGLTHYGDWAELDQVDAGLAYYEIYSDGAVGVSGPGLNDTLKDDTDDSTVSRDGYALVFEAEATVNVRDGYQFNYADAQNWTLAKPDAIDSDTGAAVKDVPKWKWTTKIGSTDYTQTFSGDSSETNPADKIYTINQSTDTDTKAYILIPLPDKVVTEQLADATVFYQKAEISPAGSTNSENVNTYYFNPHFAKTVRESVPETNPETEENPVSVRTARHLYHLSAFQTASQNLVYAIQGYYFSQEMSIDYGSYTGYYSYKEDPEYPEDPAKKSIIKIFAPGMPDDGQTNPVLPYMQNPIGSRESSFTGTYNGGKHTIQNVLYKNGTEDGGSGYPYIGLFGNASGILKNIVYEAKGQTGSLRTTNMGALAGYGATIENCEVTVNGDMTVNGTGSIFGGGMAGGAETIKSCSAIVNGNLIIHGGAGVVYGGGMAGIVYGELQGSCHAVTTGTVTVTAKHATARASAYGGGLVGIVQGSTQIAGCTAEAGGLTVEQECTKMTGTIDTYAGGLIARGDNINYTDCSATITGPIYVSGYSSVLYAGGLAGLAQSLKNCRATVNGNLTIEGNRDYTSTYGGGLVGRSSGDVVDCSAQTGSVCITGAGSVTNGGGMAGYANYVGDCTATAESVTVNGTGSGGTYGGGLAGQSAWGVQDCTVTVESAAEPSEAAETDETAKPGTVTVKGAGTKTYGGGLVGYIDKTNGDLTKVLRSSVTATAVTVTGNGNETYAGGLAGWTKQNIEDKCSATITEALSITGQGKITYGGGLTGYTNFLKDSTATLGSLTIEGNSTANNAETCAGGLAGKTEWGVNNCHVTKMDTMKVTGAGGTTYAGGLAGVQIQSNQWSDDIRYSSVTASTISVTGNGIETYSGGLVGAQIKSEKQTTDIHRSNVTLKTINVNGSGGTIYAGGLVGNAPNHVTTCSSEITTMTVTGTGVGDVYAGGLAGWVYDNVKEGCAAKIGDLSVTGSGAKTCGGGLAGYAGYSDDCTATAASVTVQGTKTSDTYGGGLAGWSEWGASRCHVAVTTLRVEGAGAETCGGGLAGRHKTISNKCSLFFSTATAGTIEVAGSGNTTCAGGLVGLTANDINNCAGVTGSLSVTSNGYAGGLAGRVDDGNVQDGITYGSIINSYAVGRISGKCAYAGGLVGATQRPVSNCYAAVDLTKVTAANLGGLVGSTANTVENGYWIKGTFAYGGDPYTTDSYSGAGAAITPAGLNSLTAEGAAWYNAGWRRLTENDAYPYPVSTTRPKADGSGTEYYYPGTEWPVEVTESTSAAQDSLAIVSEAKDMFMKLAIPLPDALPVEPKLEGETESDLIP